MLRVADKKNVDAFIASASQVFCYYSWYVEISPRLIGSARRKHEMVHFRIVENAIVMGFLINLRRLDEFFHSKKKYSDDLRAYEFGFASPGGFLSPAERKEIDKQIAHPTEAQVSSKTKVYFTYALAHQALVYVLQFIDFLLAGPDLSRTDYWEKLSLTKKRYLGFWAAYTELVPVNERLSLAG